MSEHLPDQDPKQQVINQLVELAGPARIVIDPMEPVGYDDATWDDDDLSTPPEIGDMPDVEPTLVSRYGGTGPDGMRYDIKAMYQVTGMEFAEGDELPRSVVSPYAFWVNVSYPDGSPSHSYRADSPEAPLQVYMADAEVTLPADEDTLRNLHATLSNLEP